MGCTRSSNIIKEALNSYQNYIIHYQKSVWNIVYQFVGALYLHYKPTHNHVVFPETQRLRLNTILEFSTFNLVGTMRIMIILDIFSSQPLTASIYPILF